MKRCPACDSYKEEEEFPVYGIKRKRVCAYCFTCEMARKRKYDLNKYGLTIECFDKLDKVNDSTCWICGMRAKGVLHVDHCHRTNHVRGLLCRFCNTLLGGINDDINIARNIQKNIVAYLEDGGQKVKEVLNESERLINTRVKEPSCS